jgi:UDP-N-acetylmuramoyl-tripeptide--D-alanyl-D-alanine ligase
MRFSTDDAAKVTRGTLVGPDVAFDGVAIDSRDEVSGRLFVPVVGERDGHQFIPDALAAGAAAYLTAAEPIGGTAVVVEETAAALAALGRAARERIAGEVIGITGSVGKTSVKDLLAATLSVKLRTSASRRNFNNELGVPITLTEAAEDVQALVVEMGARGVSHIAELCEIASPTIGVVTLVAEVHTEVFGTIDDVALGKGELVEALPSTGTAILNAADDRVRAMRSRTSANVVLFGAGGDVVAEDLVVDAELRPTFRLTSPWGSAHVRLDVRGVHQVENALAAAAAAMSCGLTPDDVAEGLAAAELSPWRMELKRTVEGALVINDAYNASPTSMEAAMRSLAHLDADRRIAVVGTMAELGDGAAEAHASVARFARELGIEVLAVGEDRYGVECVADIDAAADRIEPLGPRDAVLVKGSRVAGLERLADLLLD